MKTVNISYLKNNLSAIIAKLRSSGRIVVMDRDTPVAYLISAKDAGSKREDDSRIGALERLGIVRRPPRDADLKILDAPPPRTETKVDAVKLLLEEREQGL